MTLRWIIALALISAPACNLLDSARWPSPCDPPCSGSLACNQTTGQCVESICGNSLVEGVEACDLGLQNSDVNPGACRLDCTLPVCGDGVVDPGETCDDGNALSGDYCSATCSRDFGSCGDGVLNVEAGEVCDDGNTASRDYCSVDCSVVTGACGDATQQKNERCDDGNVRDNDYCSHDCQVVTGSCGDSHLQENEACDDGNRLGADYCSWNCQALTGTCGDRIVQVNEACDDGNHDAGDYCSPDCMTQTGSCGDGVRQSNEVCDGGNDTTQDGCLNSCVCDKGYVEEEGSCVDINECTALDFPCGNNATCTNLPGSVLCECKSGYSGNGQACLDVNECASDTPPCDPNASCSNLIGGFICTCKSGYSGDGVSCADINECVSDTPPCDQNATCVNSSGTFACECNQGYFGSGQTCVDVDECAGYVSPCDENAECTNSIGGFFCSCNAGYEGSGVTCEPQPCETTPSMPRGASVMKAEDGERFSSDSTLDHGEEVVVTSLCGYRCESGGPCLFGEVPVVVCLECAAGTYSQGGLVSECTPCEVGTYSEAQACSCTPCPAGHTSPEGSASVDACVDINECAMGLHDCAANERCVNTPGGFSCVCNDGYYQVGTACQKLSPIGGVCAEDTECLRGRCDLDSTVLMTLPDVSNYDSHQKFVKYGVSKALRSPVLSVRTIFGWYDQGWGNIKGKLKVDLVRDGTRVASFSEFGIEPCSPAEKGCASHTWRDVELTLDSEHEVVRRAQAGDFYEWYYRVGGGGGHELFIRDFRTTTHFEGTRLCYVSAIGESCFEDSDCETGRCSSASRCAN